jgi:hypothetical protein
LDSEKLRTVEPTKSPRDWNAIKPSSPSQWPLLHAGPYGGGGSRVLQLTIASPNPVSGSSTIDAGTQATERPLEASQVVKWTMFQTRIRLLS